MRKNETKNTAKKGIMESIQAFIETYPGLKDFGGMFPKVDVDTLEENATAYMIENVPAEPVLKKYLDGSSVRQTVFALTSREFYADCENVDTNNFYEGFADWLEQCTRTGNFPDLGTGKEVMEIKATTPGYLYDAEGEKAKYRIQCVMKFYQNK